MPAEWEPHKATWLTWPHDEAHWPGKFELIEPIFARMALGLATSEEVHIAIHDDATELSAKKHLGQNQNNIFLHRIQNNFAWARDHGPIFVRDETNKLQILNWQYNAWGDKYAHDLDNEIPVHISKITGITHIDIPMVLEGGSIDVNGSGTLLTTSSCLLNPNRNPTLTKDEIETNLKKYLGLTQIIWLENSIAGDDTSGHIDDMTRFVAPDKIVTMVEENPADINHACLQKNLTLLQKTSFEIITIPMPAPVIHQNTRLPASYANFYIANKIILLPTYNCQQDEIALTTLQKLFPARKVVPIDCTDLIWGLGSFHCLTQQQPA
ncbi:MAG: agmatine deiminase family protein [Candidatus Gracilibacteria bacterium]